MEPIETKKHERYFSVPMLTLHSASELLRNLGPRCLQVAKRNAIETLNKFEGWELVTLPTAGLSLAERRLTSGFGFINTQLQDSSRLRRATLANSEEAVGGARRA